MTRFHSIVYVQGAVEKPPEGQQPKAGPMGHVDAETSRDLAALFRKRLLDISETFKIPVPNTTGGVASAPDDNSPVPALSVFFKRVGHTAGLAAWCVGPDILAVTLLLGGFDPEEDDRALAKARRLPTESPLSALTLDDLRKRPRPLHAIIHCTPAHDRDLPLRAASACLAAVFFSLLGATVEG